MIPYGRQDITQQDIDAVVEVLRSPFLTQGPAVVRFEQAVMQRVRASHALAVNSATAALHIACLALDLGPNDVLWTVPNTFVASANCALYCGASVGFVDIDLSTWNMSVPALRAKLETARQAGRLPKIVVPVHFSGQPTEQEAIWHLSKQYGFRIIEDASHSIGAARNGEPVGSCLWSHVTVFSFHPVKIITTGEGGIVLTNDVQVAERLAMLRAHGITRDAARFTAQDATHGAPGWWYEQQMLGFNYRMTDIQAALGTSQIERLERYVERRNVLARRYGERLQHLPLQLPYVQAQNTSAFHLYVVRLREGGGTRRHREVFEGLRARGIGVNLHYMPVHLQPHYRTLGFSKGDFPQAEAHGNSAITLPLFAAMTEQEQDTVVRALEEVL